MKRAVTDFSIEIFHVILIDLMQTSLLEVKPTTKRSPQQSALNITEKSNNNHELDALRNGKRVNEQRNSLSHSKEIQQGLSDL